jgi:hypothetical protein
LSEREKGGSYSTRMARKERAEVSIFPHEPSCATKMHPGECRGSQDEKGRTLEVSGQSQEGGGGGGGGGGGNNPVCILHPPSEGPCLVLVIE